MPIGPPVPGNIPKVPWPEENLNPNQDHKKFKSLRILKTHGVGKAG